MLRKSAAQIEANVAHALAGGDMHASGTGALRPFAERLDQPRADPALLMDVMERREALAEARRAGRREAVVRLTETVRERECVVLSEITASFGREPPDLARVETLLGELRYHRRFLDEAGVALDDLE